MALHVSFTGPDETAYLSSYVQITNYMGASYGGLTVSPIPPPTY